MKERSRILLLVAELLFICSLVLPALEIVVLGKASIWEGWRATAATVGMLSDVGKDPTFLPLGAAGLGNVVFIVAPWLLLFSRPGGLARGVFACCVVGAFVLALWAPHSAIAESPKLLVGYFVWLFAYSALLGSVVLFRGAEVRLGKESGVYA